MATPRLPKSAAISAATTRPANPIQATGIGVSLLPSCTLVFDACVEGVAAMFALDADMLMVNVPAFSLLTANAFKGSTTQSHNVIENKILNLRSFHFIVAHSN